MQDAAREEKKVLLFILFVLAVGLGIDRIKKDTPVCYEQNFRFEKNQNSGDASVPENKINVNLAGLEDLIDLPGIGPALAQRIISYREAHGGFKRKEDLCEVKGIGLKKLEKIEKLIVLE